MGIVYLTALIGCVYAEAAAEAWRAEDRWQHRLRETALALIYWSMASAKYLEILEKVPYGHMA